jgi:FixJ family two-component response regulator
LGPIEEKPIISIVDDDPAVRSAFLLLLDSVGLDAETFASAEEFLASPSASATTCLVLDVTMPGLDGLELQRRLRASNWNKPIIFITAHADQETWTRALAGGAAGVFAKPFSTKAMLDAINTAIAARRRSP